MHKRKGVREGERERVRERESERERESKRQREREKDVAIEKRLRCSERGGNLSKKYDLRVRDEIGLKK